MDESKQIILTRSQFKRLIEEALAESNLPLIEQNAQQTTEITQLKEQLARTERMVASLSEKHESEDHYCNGVGDEYKRGWYSAMRNVRERISHIAGKVEG